MTAVSIVLITFNDAARLPRALASALDQTLKDLEVVVVDDSSTDGTEQVVASFAKDDPRVRYVRLDENSGGCSAPRNRGILEARGDWVMFLDSDDRLERHAAKNLLDAVESSGADLGCGVVERVDVRTGRGRRWRAEWHEPRVVDSILQAPGLLNDTVCVNKIYRRSWLLQERLVFPEGLLYEDQLFTLEAYACANRIAIIDRTVYFWYVDHLSDEPSITQRRKEVRNVESRIEINRRIDAYLAERGMGELEVVKNEKFLRHDLYLYLSSILDLDDEAAHLLMDRLRPYVQSCDLRPLAGLRPGLRIAAYHLLLGEADCIRRAMRHVRWAAVVDERIDGLDSPGPALWACPHLREGAPAGGQPVDWWLDAAAMQLGGAPFVQRRYCHRLVAMEAAGGVLRAEGVTTDYDGSLAQIDGAELVLLAAGRGPVLRVPARLHRIDERTWGWRAEGRPSAGPLEPEQEGTVALELRAAGLVNLSAVRASETPEVRIPWPGRVPFAGPDTAVIARGEHGGIAWASRTCRRTLRAALRRRWLSLPVVPALGSAWRHGRDEWLSEILQRIASGLAALAERGLLARTVVLESEAGRRICGQPEQLGLVLHQQQPRIRQIWAVAHPQVAAPAWASTVPRRSLRHDWALARASAWIDDADAHRVRRRRARYLQTGRGIPLLRTGRDDPDWALLAKQQRRQMERRVREWSLLLADTSFIGEVIAPALGYAGPCAPPGSPVGDAMLAAPGRIDLPDDRPVVLYAPLDPALDLEAWVDELGAEVLLLVRWPAGPRPMVPARLRTVIRDITDAPDLPSFLAASDLMITDYSPLLCEFARLDRPVLLLAPRWADVLARRGAYVDLATDGPGPMVAATEAVLREVRSWLAEPAEYTSRHASARARFARAVRLPTQDGSAARDLAELMESR